MISPFVVVATCASMPQFRHESVYSVRILSLLMLSAMPGMLGRNAAASIDLNSCNEVLFEDTVIILVEVVLETLSICLVGLILSCSKRFVQVPKLPWEVGAGQAIEMSVTFSHRFQMNMQYANDHRFQMNMQYANDGLRLNFTHCW